MLGGSFPPAWFLRGGLALAFAVALPAFSVACGSSSDDAPGDGGGNVGLDGGSESATGETDGNLPPDSGPPAEDAGGKGFCEALAAGASTRFCDDFDDDGRTEAKTKWEIQTLLNANLGLDTSSASSAPASVAVETAQIVGGESAHAHLRVTRAGAPTGHVSLSFSLMLATATFTQGAVAIATLDVSQNHFFTLFLRDRDPNAPTVTLEEVGPATTTRHVLAKLPTANAWTRVTIDVDVAASKATVLFGTDKVLDGASILAMPSKDPTIRLGAVYVYGPADAFGARFDDVLLEF